jgi:hypothetical protein
MSPPSCPRVLPITKHDANIIMNLNICISWGIRGSICLLFTSGMDLKSIYEHKIPLWVRPKICPTHNWVSKRSILFSRRDIHRYKVPSKYTKKFLEGLLLFGIKLLSTWYHKPIIFRCLVRHGDAKTQCSRWSKRLLPNTYWIASDRQNNVILIQFSFKQLSQSDQILFPSKAKKKHNPN